jgi:NADH dehydrogenase [ubiquinone] 1 alpha subcomplex assembly factor 3
MLKPVIVNAARRTARQLQQESATLQVPGVLVPTRRVPAKVPGGGEQQYRSISRSSRLESYEGDGKTTVTVLNHEIDSPLMIDSYNYNGFKLNNGFSVYGPVALFPKSVLGWDVSHSNMVTPETLTLFGLLEPKLDILVIGVGNPGDKIPTETIQYLRHKKISFEILSTEHACTTFNFLNVEKRCVAAALIPPTHITFSEQDHLRYKIDRKKLYEEIDKQ